MVTLLNACTVPIALSSTGMSAAMTVPAVTGTPGLAGGGPGASAAGAECRFRYAIEPAPDRARTAVATNTAFFMPDASLGGHCRWRTRRATSSRGGGTTMRAVLHCTGVVDTPGICYGGGPVGCRMWPGNSPSSRIKTGEPSSAYWVGLEQGVDQGARR